MEVSHLLGSNVKIRITQAHAEAQIYAFREKNERCISYIFTLRNTPSS